MMVLTALRQLLEVVIEISGSKQLTVNWDLLKVIRHGIFSSLEFFLLEQNQSVHEWSYRRRLDKMDKLPNSKLDLLHMVFVNGLVLILLIPTHQQSLIQQFA